MQVLHPYFAYESNYIGKYLEGGGFILHIYLATILLSPLEQHRVDVELTWTKAREKWPRTVQNYEQ